MGQVIRCTEEMTKQTLWDAMHTEQPNVEAVKVTTFTNMTFSVFTALTYTLMLK